MAQANLFAGFAKEGRRLGTSDNVSCLSLEQPGLTLRIGDWLLSVKSGPSGDLIPHLSTFGQGSAKMSEKVYMYEDIAESARFDKALPLHILMS